MTTTESRPTEPRRRGISIHRAADATNLESTDFMAEPDMSPDARAAVMRMLEAGLGAGGDVKVLVRQSAAAGGFSLVHAWFKANYPLPRHSHDSDCLYYVVTGTAIMGGQTLYPGDSFFVPADALYQYRAGPEGVEILEFRQGVDHFDIKIPDASPERWQAMADAAAANREAWERETISPTFRSHHSPDRQL